MNYRKLKCGQELIAIGNENSFADLKNKLSTHCFNCQDAILCQECLSMLSKSAGAISNMRSLAGKDKI